MRISPARWVGSDRTTRRPSSSATAASATESGVSSVRWENSRAVSGLSCSSRTSAVSAASGQRACARIGSRARSSSPCRLVVKPSTAAFDAAYTASPGTGPCAEIEAMLSRCPPRSRITSTAAREPWTTPRKFASTISAMSASGCSHTRPARSTPALLTHTVTGPSSAAAVATRRCSVACRASATIAVAPSSSAATVTASAFTSVMTTRCPLCDETARDLAPEPAGGARHDRNPVVHRVHGRHLVMTVPRTPVSPAASPRP